MLCSPLRRSWGRFLYKAPSIFRKARPTASAVFLASVSSFPECENFIAHYLLGCDEVTDDLLGAKNCVSTANIFILLYCSLASLLQRPRPQIKKTHCWRATRAHISDPTLVLIWFNSPLLLKNSICLIELFDSKIWIPCILTIHSKFPSV